MHYTELQTVLSMNESQYHTVFKTSDYKLCFVFSMRFYTENLNSFVLYKEDCKSKIQKDMFPEYKTIAYLLPLIKFSSASKENLMQANALKNVSNLSIVQESSKTYTTSVICIRYMHPYIP